jgi:cytochrome c-type biogenesis protein CcmH/NrfF
MVVGTIIAYLPERSLAFATKKIPENAATTSVLLLMLMGAAGSTLSAQHVEVGNPVRAVARTPLERDLHENIVCMCGTCGRQRIGECTCEVAARMRAKVSTLVAQGQTRDQIVQAFISEWGSQEVLGAPLDQGFNRLAWALPYGVGLLGVALVGGIALRWSRRREEELTPHPAGTASRSALEDRLDDELRELD